MESMEEFVSLEDGTSIGIESVTSEPKEKVNVEALTTEFQYYGPAVRNLAPALTNSADKSRLVPWLNKLFGAEYHVEVLRDKRNRYLASLTVNIINDELGGIFQEDTPAGAMKDLLSEQIVNAPPAEWELDTTWSDMMATLPDDYEEIRCSFHGDKSCEEHTFEMNEQMDNNSMGLNPILGLKVVEMSALSRLSTNLLVVRNRPCRSNAELINPHLVLLVLIYNEFWFLLYQIRPYAAMMPCPNAKVKVAAWMQTLCRVGCENCSKMKGLRNDYAYSLYGYVHDLRLAGPFQDHPPLKFIPSLVEAAKAAAKKYPLTSPYCEEAETFLSEQPTPEEGAFCYIAITGDVVNTDTLLPH